MVHTSLGALSTGGLARPPHYELVVRVLLPDCLVIRPRHLNGQWPEVSINELGFICDWTIRLHVRPAEVMLSVMSPVNSAEHNATRGCRHFLSETPPALPSHSSVDDC